MGYSKEGAKHERNEDVLFETSSKRSEPDPEYIRGTSKSLIEWLQSVGL